MLAGEGVPTTLRIRFERGERPYVFWVSSSLPTERGSARFKVLSKRRADRSLDVLVIEEHASGERRGIARIEVPAEAPARWLEHWVGELGGELGARFESYDVSGIASLEEWRALARRLGWVRRSP